jgi:hypothetical protein
MQICGKILTFTVFFLFFKLFFTSLVHYMFRPIWSSSGASKTAALLSMNTIPKYTLVYVLTRCCTFVVLGDSLYALCVAAVFEAPNDNHIG